MADTLKPCPLCGSSARVYDDGAGDLDSVPAWIAACDDEDGCGCETAFFDTREEAIAAWNRRAERTCTIVRGDGEFPHCSACGSLEAVDDVAGPYDYCPRCGARVIREES